MGDTFPHHNKDFLIQKPYILPYRYYGSFGKLLWDPRIGSEQQRTAGLFRPQLRTIVERLEPWAIQLNVSAFPKPPRYLLYRALGALVPYIVGTWGVRAQ